VLGRTLRRTLAGVIALALFAVPAFASSSAFGDPISDKRSEAARVADRLEELQEQAEVLAEQYNDARLALAQVEAKVEAAQERVADAKASLRRRTADVAEYAVNAYVLGDQGSGAVEVLSATDGTEVGRRQGYASAAIGNREDLLDRLRSARAEASADTRKLREVRKAAADAKARLDAKRQAAQEAVDEQQATVDRVEGELSRLLQAEQRRRAAAAERRAREAQRQAAARARRSTPTTTRQAPTTGGTGSPSAPPQTAPPAPPPPAPPVGQGASAAIAAARSVLGVRYTWAGADPSTGFDCSGLVMWAWAHGGVSLPHSSAAMYGATRRISMDQLQPGDLVFYGSPIHHVALYIGGGQIIHAPHTGSYVQIASVYYWSDVAGAGRV
jgi:cell wall-associated NlpC family hydrolase